MDKKKGKKRGGPKNGIGTRTLRTLHRSIIGGGGGGETIVVDKCVDPCRRVKGTGSHVMPNDTIFVMKNGRAEISRPNRSPILTDRVLPPTLQSCTAANREAKGTALAASSRPAVRDGTEKRPTNVSAVPLFFFSPRPFFF